MLALASVFALSLTITEMFYHRFLGCAGLPLPLVLIVAGILGYNAGKRADRRKAWRGFRAGRIPGVVLSLAGCFGVCSPGEIEPDEVAMFFGLMAAFGTVQALSGGVVGAVTACCATPPSDRDCR